MQFDFREELGKQTPKIADGAEVYIFGTGANWEYICKQYKYLVNIDIDEHIDGFIDNDISKQGKRFHNKPVYALSDLKTDNVVVLISVVSANMYDEIGTQLSRAGLYFRHSFFGNDVFYTLIMQWEYNRLLLFKNKHKGERCFIIGNGPSLTAQDLNMLENEVTFATNQAYVIFDDTKWRPTYYVIADPVAIKKSHKILKDINCIKFYACNFTTDIDNFCLTDDYFYLLDFSYLLQPPLFREYKFSEGPLVFYDGGSVSYDCLQIATFMGFSEIYLLGFDHNYSIMVDCSGKLLTGNLSNHFSEKYGGSGINTFQIELVNGAYKAAREYTEQHNIKIYNATRGGKLEIFERVDFDSLF